MIKRVVECDMCSEEATLTTKNGKTVMPAGWMAGRWMFDEDDEPTWHWVCTAGCAQAAQQEHHAVTQPLTQVAI
jgi:hypothetical protein